jgi:hypothetical protein
MGFPADLSLYRSHTHKNELRFIAKQEKCGGLYFYHAFCEGIGLQISVLLHNLVVIYRQWLSYLGENSAADNSVQ